MNRVICKSIALYGQKSKGVHIVSFYNWSLNFFRSQGLTPDYIAIAGNGYPKKIVKFDTGYKKLKEKKFADIESLNFIYNTPNSDAPAYDWLLCVSIGLGEDVDIFIGGSIDIIDLSLESGFLKSLKQLFDFEYGYLFLREFIKNPEFYVGGAGSDFISSEESGSISKWLHDSVSTKSYRLGKLRDIYDVNIINSKHLNYEIGKSQKLLDFIKSKNNEEQELRHVLDDIFIWIVSPKSIMGFRRELAESNILICYNEQVKPTFGIQTDF
jgi:hypothetical protein